jgi:hypothetical protein
MCVVVAKYFDNLGWVGVKNRDRNYIPEISFKSLQTDGTEIMLFWDDITQYCEGFNSGGVCILSASLMVLDDEKEITMRSKKPSKDGIKIKKALKYPNVKAAAMSLIKQKLTGNTIIFDRDTCYLLEGCWKPGGYSDKDYEYKITEVPHDRTVSRTNHGIMIPTAGYQRVQGDDNQTASRISSESRRAIAEYVVNHATNPHEIIDGLAKTYIENPQLNALRTTHEKKKMRTTSQIMIIPEEKTFYIRPVQSHMTFNFWDLNKPNNDLWVEILSNRILWQRQKEHGKFPFPKMNHKAD